jgi:hypothetical protein
MSNRIERTKGVKAYPEVTKALQAQWPKAFPVEPDDVRPLALTSAAIIAERFDLFEQRAAALAKMPRHALVEPLRHLTSQGSNVNLTYRESIL